MARSAGYYSGEDRVSQTKIAGTLNLFMSGATFLYYGEELGMKGSGKDENKRAPMQWS
jgi:alpha-amylase